MLAIFHTKVAIPIYSINLEKRVCSSDKEKIHLLEKFKNSFYFDCVFDLFRDREFITIKLLAYLEKEKVLSTLRIKSDNIITTAKGKEMRVEKIFKSLSVGEISVIEDEALLGSNVDVYAINLRKKVLRK